MPSLHPCAPADSAKALGQAECPGTTPVVEVSLGECAEGPGFPAPGEAAWRERKCGAKRGWPRLRAQGRPPPDLGHGDPLQTEGRRAAPPQTESTCPSRTHSLGKKTKDKSTGAEGSHAKTADAARAPAGPGLPRPRAGTPEPERPREAGGTSNAWNSHQGCPGHNSNTTSKTPRLFLAATLRRLPGGIHIFQRDHQFSPAANFPFLSFQDEGYSKIWVSSKLS